ncbi:MAG: F0F1 ATP synthase subunit B [Clostridia bacterium]|nr:F0F1 ATP synthase subunit B [Clostridia bacterium]
MQHLDVISVNVWQIIIALINLTLLFLLLKKFLYKPVEKVLKKRENELNGQYEKANEALKAAQDAQSEYEARLSGAKVEADEIIKDATDTANKRSDRIVEGAREEADAIVSRARTEAELEKERAKKDIKDEIADVSSLIAEKVLSREINSEDHKKLIDSFIEKIGDEDDIIG